MKIENNSRRTAMGKIRDIQLRAQAVGLILAKEGYSTSCITTKL